MSIVHLIIFEIWDTACFDVFVFLEVVEVGFIVINIRLKGVPHLWSGSDPVKSAAYLLKVLACERTFVTSYYHVFLQQSTKLLVKTASPDMIRFNNVYIHPCLHQNILNLKPFSHYSVIVVGTE